jgi:hypothetical protein
MFRVLVCVAIHQPATFRNAAMTRHLPALVRRVPYVLVKGDE